LSSGFQLILLIHVIVLNVKIKIAKSVKFYVTSGVVSYKSGLIYKILNFKRNKHFLYGVFVSPHGGLGGPPSFLAY
jgi:hypothetical protein